MRKNKRIKKVILRYLCIFISIPFSLSIFSQEIDSIETFYFRSKEQPKITYPIFHNNTLKDKLEDPLYFKLSQKREIELITNNAITASFGVANMYDTYLSPLEYKGTSIRLMYEQMRRTTWFD